MDRDDERITKEFEKLTRKEKAMFMVGAMSGIRSTAGESETRNFFHELEIGYMKAFLPEIDSMEKIDALGQALYRLKRSKMVLDVKDKIFKDSFGEEEQVRKGSNEENDTSEDKFHSFYK